GFFSFGVKWGRVRRPEVRMSSPSSRPGRMNRVFRAGRKRRTLLPLLVASSAVALLGVAVASTSRAQASGPAPTRSHPDPYPPQLRPPASLESILKQLTPGTDAFPEEKEAAELAGRLGELSTLLRARPGAAAEAADLLLAPTFKGGRLVPTKEVARGNSP